MKRIFTIILAITVCLLLVSCKSDEESLVVTYIEIAQNYIEVNDYDAAINTLQKALEISDDAEIQALLTDVLLLQTEELKEKSMERTDDRTNNELTEENEQAQIEYATSTPENDTDIGMRNVKIDSADIALNDDQRLVREYFDRDYLKIYYYDDLQRYPDAYDNAQVHIIGVVERMISSDSDNFELLLRTTDVTNDTENDLIYVTGAQANVRVIQGDMICVYGRYLGIETVSIDDSSYVIPVIKSFRTLFAENDYELPERFDNKDIKKIASLIFGSGIEVRLPNNENEQGNSKILDCGWVLDNPYIVELENKSNAKLDKFRFYTETGYIDAVGPENSTIVRTIEFTQDFEHFYVISYDWALSTGEVTCYDTSLQRVWTREFENVVTNTSQIPYDFTKNNFYIATNNRLYIINAETGEDTYPPVYIGTKTEIRKLKDGILAFSAEQMDPIMFMDLNGNIQWTTNIEHCLGILWAANVQLVDDKIVTQAAFVREMDRILVIDQNTGELILDCLPSVYY